MTPGSGPDDILDFPARVVVAVLIEASPGAMPSETPPVVLTDAGVENANAQVDALITAGVLRRVLAFTELKFSNSMIEDLGCLILRGRKNLFI